MKRDEIKAEYDVDDDGTIQSPGRFEGEAIYAPHFYDATLDGCAEELSYMEDGCGEYAALVEIDDDDRREFPEIPASMTHVLVMQSDLGFVGVGLLDDAGADKARKDYEPEDEPEDEL